MQKEVSNIMESIKRIEIKLLWRDLSVDGVKTGYTKKAGYCLVASAKRDGMRLVSVVLGTASDQDRMKRVKSF